MKLKSTHAVNDLLFPPLFRIFLLINFLCADTCMLGDCRFVVLIFPHSFDVHSIASLKIRMWKTDVETHVFPYP